MGNSQSRNKNGATLSSGVLVDNGSLVSLIRGGGGGKITRSSLHQMSVEFANVLRGNGIKPGDVVTVVDSNTIDFVVAFLGVTYARAVAAPLNQNYTTEEFKYYMEDAKSKLLVTGAQGNAAARRRMWFPSEVDLKVEDVFAKDPPKADDVALFLHTSGTTSRPKEDVSLLVMPLFHVHGLMAGLLSPLSAGASVVLPEAGKFSAGTFWKDAVEHKVTFYTAVPTMHQILASRAEQDYPKDNPPPIRVIRSCSSSLAPATLHQVEKLFGAPVLEAYAMTEASHQMTSNPLPKHGERKPGTVGKPQGSVKVAILSDSCKVLGAGEVGEVCIRGPNVTKGYKDNPKANKEAFAGGWFHTGDQGYLSEDGYLTLTGRIKELINRGGEKISPLEVDATLLAHPLTPDGVEELESKGEEDIIKSIKEFCGGKLSAFKIPKQIFITDTLPKNATGKIQRRFMVDAFINKKPSEKGPSTVTITGYDLAARTLHKLGIRYMFGVIGIPVTQMASAAQAAGIRFISCRNEQAAGYAAAAAGFLTGKPGVLLTVSGPGMVHGIAGLSHAKVNNWPLILISGSCETNEVGKGAFQELDQCAAAAAYTRASVQAKCLEDIPSCIESACRAAMSHGYGASYVDVPSNVFMSTLQNSDASQALLSSISGVEAKAKVEIKHHAVSKIIRLIGSSSRPLLVLGVGSAMDRAEKVLRDLVDTWKVPFISASMARGVVPDSSPYCANAARSLALAKADTVLVLGNGLNWQLHFGEAPKWSKDATFVLIDGKISSRDKKAAHMAIETSVQQAVTNMLHAKDTVDSDAWDAWRQEIEAKVSSAKAKLSIKLAKTIYPLNYHMPSVLFAMKLQT
eukprot:jgi/Picre1/29170/NNA_004563.t1